jgi:hypothetical protein
VGLVETISVTIGSGPSLMNIKLLGPYVLHLARRSSSKQATVRRLCPACMGPVHDAPTERRHCGSDLEPIVRPPSQVEAPSDEVS